MAAKGKEKVREFEMVMCTLLYLKWITNKALLYSTKNSTQCCMTAWIRAGFWGEWIHVYVWLLSFTFNWNYHNTVNRLSVQSLSRVRLFVTPWTAACQASLSITNCRSLPKPISIKSVMPSNHLILCRPLLLLPSVFPSIRVFSNESALRIRWPKYSSFSFNISPSNEHPGLISFRMDWLDHVTVQGTQESSPTPQCINSSTLSFLYSPTLTSIHDHWKNHSPD